MIETQSAVNGEAPTAAPDITPKERSQALVVLIVVLVLLVGIGVLLDRVTTQTTHPVIGPPVFAAAAFPREVRDDFATRAGLGMGFAPTGQHWIDVNGSWAVGDNSAGPVTTVPSRRAYALVHVGGGPGSVEVTAKNITKGMGLAFRCRSDLDCWTLTAVPEFGTWKVTKITNATAVDLGNLTNQPVADGTRIRVALSRDSIEFFVNDVLAKHIDDPALNDAPQAGMVVDAEAGALSARFANFTAEQTNIVGSDAPVRDDFDRKNATTLGTATTGQRWKVDSGTWGIRLKEGVMESAPTFRPSLATIETGRHDGWVQVTGTTIPDGFGMVFRYRDPANYWRVVAVPGYATWNVFKVVGGRETRVGSLGLATFGSASTIGVRLEGTTMSFFVDGFEVPQKFTDPALANASSAGITIATIRGIGARFAGIAAGPLTLAGAAR